MNKDSSLSSGGPLGRNDRRMDGLLTTDKGGNIMKTLITLTILLMAPPALADDTPDHQGENYLWNNATNNRTP
jgi:hypothetical protein